MPEDITAATDEGAQDVSEQANDTGFNAGFDEGPAEDSNASSKVEEKEVKTAGKTAAVKPDGEKAPENAEGNTPVETDAEAVMQTEKANEAFWNEVHEDIPEARTIAASPEFADWLGKQPEHLRKLSTSLEKADAVYLLNEFKSANPKSEASKVAVISDDPLKGLKFKHGENEISLEQFEADYGEVAVGIRAMAEKIAERIAEKKMGEMLKTADLGKGVKSQLDNLLFWDAIRDSHPDGKKVMADKEFNSWLESQPATLKKLATSKDAEAVVYVLGKYKETKTKTAVEAVETKAKKQKETLDKVHGETLRDDKGIPSKTAKDQNDFMAGFEDGE